QHRKLHTVLLIVLVNRISTFSSIHVSLAFNIDVTEPDVYTGEQNDFFGYKVLQFISGTNKGIIVTAPLQLNGSGGICKPGKNQDKNNCVSYKDVTVANKTIPVKHLGLSIAADYRGSQFTFLCDISSNVCYTMTDELREISSFKPAFEECTRKTVDLVFLFDGSASMTEDEFTKNKDFIVDIMKTLQNTSIKVTALLQHETFQNIYLLNYIFRTGYKYCIMLSHILEKPDAGASPDATKVLVLITDGDPSDTDRNGIIKRYNDKKIIRFVIGVKAAKLDKFTAIASEPTDKYAFQIEDYYGLKGILENFQNRIFTMEGSTGIRAGDMTSEMAQSGFSAVFHRNLILGSVGSNSWRGSLQELQEQNETQIVDPKMLEDSYMGYSVSVGEMKEAPLYFTGAPRFNHTGQVVLFKQQDKSWTVAQKLNGHQIGSYFGAELCSVDINSDSNTDFLLVGAPLFYQPQEKREGQIYVYTMTDEMQLKNELSVTVPSMGRFGTTIASLADLNGDGLRDIAVGAPMEDDNRGAVYIYLGDKHQGIRSTFSQRIMGQEIQSGLRFFGQAIDGKIDLGKDGLPDIVIGSQGTAVVLRSRPVFNVMAHLSFQPEEISTEKIYCPSQTDETLPMVTLKVCFEMAETTKSKAGAMNSGLNISYTLNVDPVRQTHYRGFFGTDTKARNHTNTHELREKNTCFNYSIHMPKCVTDTLSPIIIKLNFSQVESENKNAILNCGQVALYFKHAFPFLQVPFEKQCAKNDTCIAELEVDFSFLTPTLLVAEDNYFNVSIKLSNHGDDSYNTSLIMHHPPGLSLSRMILKEATRPILHSCNGLQGVLDKTVCGVSRPVYRSRSAATFLTSFFIINKYEWNDTISMTIIGHSIPVQLEIKMAITIANPGLRPFPVDVFLSFPTKLENNFEIMNYNVSVQQSKTQCNISDNDCSPEKYCKTVRCDTFILEKESDVEVKLSAHVQFRDLKERAKNIDFLKKYTGDSMEVKFKSSINVGYNTQRYVLDSHKQENFRSTLIRHRSHFENVYLFCQQSEVRVELIILPNQNLIILTGTGLGLLLLLIITIIMCKMGCFKRKRFYTEEEEENALQVYSESTPAPTNGLINQPETEDKSDQLSEDKMLLDDGEAGNSTLLADTKEGLE
uniref:VWFA domain-containing protein n=1 Tax=Lates calcarifer TaxID=8187 RepID=A0A4W6DAS3_LATCA